MNALPRFLKSTRLWGLLGTGVVLYVFFIYVLGRIDMTWAMPDTDRMARAIIKVWPQMPFFVQTQQTKQGEVVYYNVSTHLLTPAEMKQMGLTNAMAQPAKPR
jgi:hypothetical protein